MVEVIGVSFKQGGRIYYFNPNNLELNKDDAVIVETERGLQYGIIVTDKMKIKKENIASSLKNVIRNTTEKDERTHLSNIEESRRALKECERLIKKYNLAMKLIDADFTFNREQLMYHFLSESRIDFRDLAKELAGIFRTRIELRQIGVRDKAKEVGGLGPCGRTLCCTEFLINFNTISINLAKNQNLSLSPTKINGSCGRLLCCLTYENDVYEEYRKQLPELGEIVKYEGKRGKVVSLDILKRTYTIHTDGEEYITVIANESTK